MATARASASAGCISILAVLLAIKLTHEITWSWWLVTAPAWVFVAFALAAFAIAIGGIGAWLGRNL
jgi:hypothetical protein